MENVLSYISVVFILTAFLTVWVFYKATNKSKTALIVLLSWLSIQAFLGIIDFYKITSFFPPRLMLSVLLTLFLISGLFLSASGRNFIDSLDLRVLTILHTIRIPIEIVLFWLFLNKAVPELMTFKGKNFDIVSGLTAPLVFYFGFVKKKIDKKIILIWNFICLGLLLNIIVIAFLSAPFKFQRLALNQPNIAVLYFPFNWLPTCIVPLVLFSHLAAIRQLLIKGNQFG
jgi:hypothetical protein